MKSETKFALLFLAVVIALLILLHGTEMGTFHKTSDTMYHLWGLYYLLSVAAAVLYFVVCKKIFKGITRLQKAGRWLFLLCLCALPSYLLLGLTGYIDFYTTNKYCKTMEVSVAGRTLHSTGRVAEYSYKLAAKDTMLYLDSKVVFRDDETFVIEVCTTRLGNVVADIKYGGKH